jgi:type I restriction enzyme, S subunit
VKMSSPNLRFLEFKDRWNLTELGKVVEFKKGSLISKADISSKGKPCILYGELYTKYGPVIREVVSRTNRELVNPVIGRKNDVLIPSSGESAIDIACASAIDTDEQVILGGDLNVLTPLNGVNGKFISYQINGVRKVKLSTFAQGASVVHLYNNSLKHFEITLPKKEEQQKIADFFSLLDRRIEKQQKKIEALKEQKKGLLQKIFSQEVRFKDDDGKDFPNWGNKRLNELLYEHKIRNEKDTYSKNEVLSVSGTQGIVNQIKLQGRSFAGVSVTNYHVVHTGDIVYTKSPLKQNPYGIIKVNKGVPGIVSTLYAVYSCLDTVNGEYLDYYFQIDENTNRYLKPLVNKGAKNDMKVNNAQVLVGEILIPSIVEQNKIVNFMNLFDGKMNKEEIKLNLLQEQKKGFMQQMFV